MKYWKIVAIAMISSVLLTGCFGATVEEELFTVFEDTAKKEEGLQGTAESLSSLEQQDEELYNKILEDAKKSSESVQGMLEDALKGVDEREKLIEKEKEILTEAHKVSKTVENVMTSLEKKELRNQAKETQGLYNERYEKFLTLATAYKEALTLEKELYTMLKGDNVQLKEISDQVMELNETYSAVSEANTSFNELTKKFNDGKAALYKAMDLKVKE